jgi:hypothetical protein
VVVIGPPVRPIPVAIEVTVPAPPVAETQEVPFQICNSAGDTLVLYQNDPTVGELGGIFPGEDVEDDQASPEAQEEQATRVFPLVPGLRAK